MYAIVETGGKQYKAEKGEILLVDRLPAKQGEKVGLRAVMFRDGEVITDAAELDKVKVEATVTEHLRGPKVRIFKYKAKKGSRRRAGHRSELTRLEVTEVKKLTRKPAGAKAEAKPAEKAEAKPAEKAEAKPAAARKPAAKKSTGSARKTGTTRKTTAKKTTTRKTSTRKTTKKEGSGGS